jgi:putative flippase GtrA
VATRQEPRREFLSFALVGVVGTITHYATILALIQFAGTSPVMGTLAESRA